MLWLSTGLHAFHRKSYRDASKEKGLGRIYDTKCKNDELKLMMMMMMMMANVMSLGINLLSTNVLYYSMRMRSKAILAFISNPILQCNNIYTFVKFCTTQAHKTMKYILKLPSITQCHLSFSFMKPNFHEKNS
jgi:hypothetical protein